MGTIFATARLGIIIRSNAILFGIPARALAEELLHNIIETLRRRGKTELWFGRMRAEAYSPFGWS